MIGLGSDKKKRKIFGKTRKGVRGQIQSCKYKLIGRKREMLWKSRDEKGCGGGFGGMAGILRPRKTTTVAL